MRRGKPRFADGARVVAALDIHYRATGGASLPLCTNVQLLMADERALAPGELAGVRLIVEKGALGSVIRRFRSTYLVKWDDVDGWQLHVFPETISVAPEETAGRVCGECFGTGAAVCTHGKAKART